MKSGLRHGFVEAGCGFGLYREGLPGAASLGLVLGLGRRALNPRRCVLEPAAVRALRGLGVGGRPRRVRLRGQLVLRALRAELRLRLRALRRVRIPPPTMRKSCAVSTRSYGSCACLCTGEPLPVPRDSRRGALRVSQRGAHPTTRTSQPVCAAASQGGSAPADCTAAHLPGALPAHGLH